MWGVADRMMKRFSDLTVGTVIVLVHVALADREQQQAARAARAVRHTTRDGSRVWHTQISP